MNHLAWHEISRLIFFGKKKKKKMIVSSAAVMINTLTLVLLNPDMPCLCKQCRSRSVGLKKPTDLDLHCLPLTTVLSSSLGKTFFAWRFILNENILLWLTISYQKPFVFSVSVFCSQICTLKLNLSPKIGLTYAISIVKWFFGIFVLVNIFYFSLLNLN